MKVKFEKSVKIEEVKKVFENFVDDVEFFEWFDEVVEKNGSGIYEVKFGSRGEIDDILKNDEYYSLEEMCEKYEDYDDEFYYEGKVEYSNKEIGDGMFSVVYGEDWESVFVNVEV